MPIWFAIIGGIGSTLRQVDTARLIPLRLEFGQHSSCRAKPTHDFTDPAFSLKLEDPFREQTRDPKPL